MSKHKPYHNGSFPRTFDKHEPPEIVSTEKKFPSKTWKKKYECKKGKGKHDWAVLSVENRFEYIRETSHGTAYGSCSAADKPANISWADVGVRSSVNWRCRACDKHSYEFLVSDGKKSMFGRWGRTSKKKLDPYRQNFI